MRLRLLLTLVFAGCASVKPPSATSGVNVTVVAKSPLKQADADLFRRITEDYIHRYAHDGRPLTVSITLGEQPQSMNGYWSVDSLYSVQSGHAVPLVGGMTAAEVGFIPTVGGESSGGYSSPVYFGGVLTATYSITDSTGKVLESRLLPLVPPPYITPFLATRLQDFHDTGMYIAKRVARVGSGL